MELLGSVEDGPDTVHLTVRTDFMMVGPVRYEMLVQTVRRTDDGWVALPSKFSEILLGFLEARQSKVEFARHGGIVPRIPDADFYEAAERAYSSNQPDVEPPRLIYKVQPDFPEKVRRTRVHKEVLLECVIDERGVVAALYVATSAGDLLDEAAKAAVRQWRYEPARKDGAPVPYLFPVRIVYTHM